MKGILRIHKHSTDILSIDKRLSGTTTTTKNASKLNPDYSSTVKLKVGLRNFQNVKSTSGWTNGRTDGQTDNMNCTPEMQSTEL